VLQKLTGNMMGMKSRFLLSLGCHSKPARDERDLPRDVPFFHATHLPFPDHVHDLLSPARIRHAVSPEKRPNQYTRSRVRLTPPPSHSLVETSRAGPIQAIN